MIYKGVSTFETNSVQLAEEKRAPFIFSLLRKSDAKLSLTIVWWKHSLDFIIIGELIIRISVEKNLFAAIMDNKQNRTNSL